MRVWLQSGSIQSCNSCGSVTSANLYVLMNSRRLARLFAAQPKTRRNEPKYLAEILNTVAECCARPKEQLARETGENAARLFGLPKSS